MFVTMYLYISNTICFFLIYLYVDRDGYINFHTANTSKTESEREKM